MDTRQLGHLYTDCLVIGGGVAGLQAALSASEGGDVLVLVKDTLEGSNSYYAQGGIAVVLREGDSIDAHVSDTLRTGCGLCDEEAVELVVREGPARVRQLVEWSEPFDREGGELAVGREGGHSCARVIHAQGDSTGRVTVECLRDQVQGRKGIKVFEECFSIDLLTEDGICKGVLCYNPKYGLQCIWSRRTILATGGAGQLYRETTNPAGATADGLAMAYRAGAILRDMEFMQFHPTTLYVAGATRTLVTEALRGEGAYLVDRKGERFMGEYHEMKELAPRDVVSQAIYDHMRKTNATNVFLDVRHLGAEWLGQRFPTIGKVCRDFDINVDTDLIPVRPSAHYMVGGVKTDLQGRTNIGNLYCCGEAAATGLHGSNRLASNSLLEALVFGHICGETAAKEIAGNGEEGKQQRIVFDVEESERSMLDIPDVTNSLRSIMWRNVGIERNGERLEETLEIIDFWRRYVMDKVFNGVAGWECQNMLTVCRIMVESARQREESRGVHFRCDYPKRDDEHFQYHIEVGPHRFE
jgi:L-aspartate oxidase